MEQTELRLARLDKWRVFDHERRALEQAVVRQASICLKTASAHERRAGEQPEARQARLEKLRERNRK